MSEKVKDPKAIKHNVSHKPIDYVKLNQLSEDFGKRFVPQMEMSAEQAYWLPILNPKYETPVKIKVPAELPKDIVNIVTSCAVNESVNMNNYVNEKCSKCLELETELIKKCDMIERDVFDKLFELTRKGHVIRMLKDKIKTLCGKSNIENVKKDIDEIETINIELEHSVANLLSENKNLRKEREHLKSIYKDQFDSIKKTCVRSKEHSDSLIAQINAKSVENSDLNAQLQEKVFTVAALKNELRKLKEKNVADIAVSTPIATTIAHEKFKLDIEPISHKLKNNRDP
ncbi:hypothetical protein Tco_0535461 [Tanacetum coccineum]